MQTKGRMQFHELRYRAAECIADSLPHAIDVGGVACIDALRSAVWTAADCRHLRHVKLSTGMAQK